jgi:hypothetical protein
LPVPQNIIIDLNNVLVEQNNIHFYKDLSNHTELKDMNGGFVDASVDPSQLPHTPQYLEVEIIS